MKRTQLYLDEDIWKVLHIHSRQRRTSISNLVRQAIRDRYGSSPANRSKAMQALVGIWRDVMAYLTPGNISASSARASGYRE
jgi:hypothetical protein